MSNPFTLIAALPASFHEVHGPRPRFASHGEASAWLARMEAATLVSASNTIDVAAATGDVVALEEARSYFEAHNAIAALRAA